MYYLNKIVFALVNPLALSLTFLAISMLLLAKCECKKKSLSRRIAVFCGMFALIWMVVFSLPLTIRILGNPLENKYPIVPAEQAPTADAIVLLGGGMASNTNTLIYAEMNYGADRVWQAVRLYRAGKAPLILITGIAELDSTKPLLLDFGIPEEAIIVENDSRNTEENALFTQKMLLERLGANAHPKVLLVTSAWHMKRSEFTFRRYAPALEIIPFPGDYNAMCHSAKPFKLKELLVSPDALHYNSDFFKEHIGYWGYRLFRH